MNGDGYILVFLSLLSIIITCSVIFSDTKLSAIFGYKGISSLNSFLSRYNPYSAEFLGYFTVLLFIIPRDNAISVECLN